jgi:hypothetical protein
MEKYFNINKLVNRLTDNEGLKTYYTLLLMADTPSEKETVDNRFWQKFDELPTEEKRLMRLALQEVEKNLLAETKNLHQEVKSYKDEFGQLKQAA